METAGKNDARRTKEESECDGEGGKGAGVSMMSADAVVVVEGWLAGAVIVAGLIVTVVVVIIVVVAGADGVDAATTAPPALTPPVL